MKIISNTKNDSIKRVEEIYKVLKKNDFISFKANWNPKSMNITETAQELTLLPESFVFVDDNPAERAIIEEQVKGVAIPDIKGVEHYIQTIDKAGFFEVTAFSSDDLKRNEEAVIVSSFFWYKFDF